MKSNSASHKDPYDHNLDRINDKQERSYSFCSTAATSSSASSINSLSNLSISPSKSSLIGHPIPDDKLHFEIFRDYAKTTKSHVNIDGYSNHDSNDTTQTRDYVVGSRSHEKIKPILKKRSTLYHRHSLGEQSNEYHVDSACLSPTDNQLSPGSTKPQSILKKKSSFDTAMSNLRPILKKYS